MRQVAAIVVTYNRKEMLGGCIDHILAQQDATCDILVIDNASTDGTGEAVAEMQRRSDRIRYFNTGSNLGGAGGFSYGMRKAVEEGYEYLWVMDDDTYPAETALCTLLEADQAIGGDYGFLSSCALWKDGRICRMNRQKVWKKFRRFIEEPVGGMVRVEQATFVSLFLRRETVEKAGLPIKEFFIWGDDIEYTRRISIRMGLPCYYVGRSCVMHMMENNCGSNISADVPEKIGRYRYAFRNDRYIYREEGLKGRLWYQMKCAYNILRIYLKAKDHKKERIRTLRTGKKEGKTFHPPIEYVHFADDPGKSRTDG